MSISSVFPRRTRHAASAAALCAALAAPGAVSAAIVSGSLSFTALALPVGAPLSPVSGSVSFSFDNSANFAGAADGSVFNGAPVQVALLGIDLPGNWTPVLTYFKAAVLNGVPFNDVLAIGHATAGTAVNAGTDDWRIAFNAVSTSPGFREFTYASAALSGQLFTTFSGSVTAVPEPASAVLLGLGLAAVLSRRVRG